MILLARYAVCLAMLAAAPLAAGEQTAAIDQQQTVSHRQHAKRHGKQHHRQHAKQQRKHQRRHTRHLRV